MSGVKYRWPAVLAIIASTLGLSFAALSSIDYARHLDRQIHDIHCSYIPGAEAEQAADNACRVAMYSPFSALFRDRYWGGVPIALFALGAFSFFAGFAAYLLLAGRPTPRRAAQFLAIFGSTPLLVSILMGVISALRLGHFCKTCVGIYASSTLLAVAGIATLVLSRSDPGPPVPADRTVIDPEPYGASGDRGSANREGVAARSNPPPRARSGQRADSHWLFLPAWALALGLCAIIPALLYVSALPNYSSFITGCGKLEKPAEPKDTLLHVTPPGATQPVTLFVDPLCPTCKAFHQRLVTEGVLDQLDITLVLFPLDSDCNWMLDRPVHPGSCVVTKAILCSDHRAMQVLEWAYDNQDAILASAKSGAGLVNVRAMIKDRFPGLDACMDSKETKLKLDRTLRYIVNNHLPISTPQMFLGDTKLCDEDTDMGLSYTIRRLAPALKAAQ